MRARAIAIAAAAAAAAALAGAPLALAHGERDPAIRTFVDQVDPEAPGLTVRVLPGAAQRLEVVNGSGRTLELRAPSGEPWLRVGPAGVEANAASATWFASGNPDGIYRAPGPVGPDRPPRWQRVSSEPRWAWFAHELHPRASAAAPADIVAAGRRARLNDWRIRTRLDGRDGEIAGHLEYRPVRGSFTARLVEPSGGRVAPGVTVAILNARSPGVFLSNTGATPVEVEGGDGRPFARVGRGGTRIDVASPTYAEQPGAPAGRPAPPGSARPVWRRLPGAATLSWVEPRARYGADEPPERDVGRRTVVRRWTVDLRIGGRRVPVRAETVWVPVQRRGAAAAGRSGAPAGGASAVPWIVVALLAAGGGAWLLRRRAQAPG
ncbi:MAG TPA: hypothetical protein VF533_18875 [Solirubrobacteraceae bacterium]